MRGGAAVQPSRLHPVTNPRDSNRFTARDRCAKHSELAEPRKWRAFPEALVTFLEPVPAWPSQTLSGRVGGGRRGAVHCARGSGRRGSLANQPQAFPPGQIAMARSGTSPPVEVLAKERRSHETLQR